MLNLLSISIENVFNHFRINVDSFNENISNSTSELDSIRCETGLMECAVNEICRSTNKRRRHGFCVCKDGFVRNKDTKNCVSLNSNQTEYSTTESPFLSTASSSTVIPVTKNEEINPITETNISTTTNRISTTTSTPPLSTTHETEKLVVSITNKTVQLLPGKSVYEQKVTLSAYAIGATECKFEWTLLVQPNSDVSGSVSDPNTETITLSQLVPGVYIFRVAVDASGAHGEAIGNVTVLPAQRVNKPPTAVIVPAHQVVKLPNSGVILDGSGSIDDGEIESYRWEIVTGPLGYKLSDESSHTLKLTQLIPGNYTIMLKVKDSEKLEGNTTAMVTVIKETDYPPSANAGGDQIIYLPQKETVLNGNASSDDHGIVEWEWTKGPEDSGKAVDMQDTRTPYLRLSNLKVGHYHFLLRVVDNASQSATSSAHVYVHEPNLSTPVANSGSNITIVLPNNTVVLDGSKTTNFSPQVHNLWVQMSGPSKAHISNDDKIKVNVTGLTRGVYMFKLTVWLDDDKSHNTSSNVTVTVLQNENLTPKANAGGDFSVILPVSVVIINGSSSTDDVGITKWVWERDPTSLAAGKVINNSNSTSVLMLTDVVAGRYVWKLTVYDDQGASSSDTVSIIIKEGIFFFIFKIINLNNELKI